MPVLFYIYPSPHFSAMPVGACCLMQEITKAQSELLKVLVQAPVRLWSQRLQDVHHAGV